MVLSGVEIPFEASVAEDVLDFIRAGKGMKNTEENFSVLTLLLDCMGRKYEGIGDEERNFAAAMLIAAADYVQKKIMEKKEE